ncbi:50S ribosomal protein L29 [Candidatus Uhrbacteria bacterium RIFCSPHIGHO2_01_FULL_63_20]|uniref:Large ribosomal subunit protein uL29 n=1 Tax=Candidatus Uhrbacteria bacterium RIFCSPHIGHO2_01_FULL_63_20 TaxID=1802385 RepID=A0A1F7TMI1_9BACT|nr:MAG: 50S ribosomal protein L29 [Candidatus Uhrbacteria bacterium RIFCSPHIGHO2_01_FULL_63_20]
MKRKDTLKELRAKSAEALVRERATLATHLRDLAFKLSSNQLKDVRKVREAKTRLARVNAVLAEKATA